MASFLLKMALAAAVILLLWTPHCLAQGSNPPTTQHLPLLRLELTNQGPQPSPGIGRVVLTTENKVFGSICPKNWTPSQTLENVRVICNMLGYPNGGSRVPNTYGVGNKNFLIEGLTCQPGNQTLNDCAQTFQKTCQPADEELAVICNDWATINGSGFWTAPPGSVPSIAPGTTWGKVNVSTLNPTYVTVNASCPNPSNIRLYSSDLPDIQGIGNGYVQILNSATGNWEYVCDDKWSEAIAKVVCAHLCFPTVSQFIPRPGILADSVKYPQNGIRSDVHFECNGTEGDVTKCKNTSTSTGTCIPGQDALAGVQCLPANNTILNHALANPNVSCGNGKLSISFPSSSFPPLTASNVQVMGNPQANCVTMNSTSNNFTVAVSINPACAVSVTENSTDIIYSAMVRLIWTSLPVSNQYINHRYELNCSIPKTGVVTNRFQPFTLSPLSSLFEDYDFNLTLELYQNNMFAKPLAGIGGSYLVEVGSWINAAVVMEKFDNRLKVVIDNCDAHSVLPVHTQSQTQTLITKKCPSMDTLAMYPLDNHREGFRFKAFQFQGYSMVYLRCEVTICLASSQALVCDRSCGAPTLNGRRKREADGIRESVVNSNTILLYDPKTPEFSELMASLGGQLPTETTGNEPIQSEVPGHSSNTTTFASGHSVTSTTKSGRDVTSTSGVTQSVTTVPRTSHDVTTTPLYRQNVTTTSGQGKTVTTTLSFHHDVISEPADPHNVPTSAEFKLSEIQNAGTNGNQQLENAPLGIGQQDKSTATMHEDLPTSTSPVAKSSTTTMTQDSTENVNAEEGTKETLTSLNPVQSSDEQTITTKQPLPSSSLRPPQSPERASSTTRQPLRITFSGLIINFESNDNKQESENGSLNPSEPAGEQSRETTTTETPPRQEAPVKPSKEEEKAIMGRDDEISNDPNTQSNQQDPQQPEEQQQGDTNHEQQTHANPNEDSAPIETDTSGSAEAASTNGQEPPSAEIGVQGQASALVEPFPDNGAAALPVPTISHACIALVAIFARFMLRVW